MRKPGGMVAIMFGHPSPMAHEDNDAPPRDEDNLNREQEFGDDGPADTLELLYDRLKRGDEVAASSAMAIARCIQEMAHRAAAGDNVSASAADNAAGASAVDNATARTAAAALRARRCRQRHAHDSRDRNWDELRTGHGGLVSGMAGWRLHFSADNTERATRPPGPACPSAPARPSPARSPGCFLFRRRRSPG